MRRQLLSTIGLLASVLAFLIGAALAVVIVLSRPELGPGLKDARIARDPGKPLYETVSASEPLRRLLMARARKSDAAADQRAKPSLAKSAVAWPQERAGRRGMAALARERMDRRIAALPKRRLELGPNQTYHTAVAEAAMLTGLSPAAIAALIDAEARKTRSGLWDPKSTNPASTARGLAQFLEKTWLEQARDPSRFLYREARSRGLIDAKGAPRRDASSKAARKTKAAKIAAPQKPEGLQVAAMAKAEATPDTAAKPKSAPARKLSPAQIEARNLEKLLELRLEPRVAIIAAAELAADNLVALARSGYAPEDDEAAAKLAYLAHHEGLTGARAHLKGVVNRARASKRLKANITEERAERLLAAHDGKPHRAYAAWLEDYIAKRIQPDRFHSELN